MTRDDATLRQVRAADPGASTWVSANAGSGKTRVLTDRVARLLFHGVRPQHILCLTYTRAAASEMQIRLFGRLGSWAMSPDDALRRDLADMGEDRPLTDEDLRRARQMFATAIETPGGLKIQTIHSFCSSILRRFPLEAGVSPEFREIDERAARILREEVVNDIAAGPGGDVIEDLGSFGHVDLDKLTRDIVGESDRFPVELDSVAILAASGVPGDAGPDWPASIAALSDLDMALVARVADMVFDKSTDTKLADTLKKARNLPPNSNALEVLERAFLTQKGVVSSRMITNGGRDLLGNSASHLDDLAARVEAGHQARVTQQAAQKTLALHRFAVPFLARYGARKQSAGWLDFDDLILLAGRLLTDPRVAEWVLYRLDGGIDHILVDEAQDTSPGQWKVIELLAREFTSGEGSRPGEDRTIFVVGDRKQSIYSFQGAAPDEFERMRDHFSDRLDQIGKRMERVQLDHSFRSAPRILNFVDAALAPWAKHGLGDHLSHLPFDTGRAGRVDLWPLVESDPASKEDQPWHVPFDRVSPSHPAKVLAAAIADNLAGLIKGGATIPDRKGHLRSLRPGDVLILVQRRSGPLFNALINALKVAGLPVAGADQLKLESEIAVQDIRALLSFIATPEDDLSLAVALRSPLFGLSEDALYRIAQPRPKGSFLWQSLRAAMPEGTPTRDMLGDLLDQADFLRPFEMIDRILTRHGGRRRILARLGPEAEEGIDALLSLSLAYERTEVPSLTGFLSWLGADEVKVKREMDGQGDQIRVMTVHGAKGLESPMVILPDTQSRKRNAQGDAVIADDAGTIWKPVSDAMDARATAALDARKQLENEERLRLLYVAMTRAESWLVIAAGGTADAGSWYQIAADGVAIQDPVPLATPVGEGLRLQSGDWEMPGPETAKQADRQDAPRPAPPEWADRPAPRPDGPARTLSPSKLPGAKALPGEANQDQELAMAQGTTLHRLLEHLPRHPESTWPDAAAAIAGGRVEPGLMAEARAILTHPDLAHIFAPDVLAEVDVTAALPELGGQRIRGAIDRLIVQETRVLAIDFKSNAMVPPTPRDVPPGLLRQMGAYRSALQQVFPNRTVDVAILWTKTAQLMPLPHDIVRNALEDTPAS